MWIDTHCHLDAREFANAGLKVAAQAQAGGVAMIVIPAVCAANFPDVATLAHGAPNACYALGIHPMYVPQAHDDDLRALRRAVEAALLDPRFVAIGEIGLDFFIPMLCEPAMRDKQERFFKAQLKIARDFDLPVLTHVRRSQDQVVKYLRQVPPAGGIAHAFNGSHQQASAFLKLGMHLGFGGAMTFTRALQIRRLAAELPLESIVLETDAPDMSPAWLHPATNSPEQLPAIGALLAQLRGVEVDVVRQANWHSAQAAIPRLAALLSGTCSAAS